MSLKGGNNDEPHNHNDLGTFVVVKGNQPLIVDPGNSPYTATTFSARRYENPMLSSFGHPVPRLAGMLQRSGKKAIARVTRAEFTDAADDYELDLKSAYAVVSLTSYRRAFHFARGAKPLLTVTDHVEFAVPATYESALVTYGQWEKNEDGSLTIWQGGQAIRVVVDAGDEPWTVTGEPFGPNVKRPTRIAIGLTKPATSFTVSLTVTPSAPPK